MPKPLFTGESPKPTDPISHPVLRYTDAHPRDDLRDLGDAATCSPPQVAHFHRPAGRPQEKRRPAPGLDLKAVPPAEMSASMDALHEGMIGIALGSPRMVESQMIESQMASHIRQDSHSVPDQPGKSSKWRKIGGLFKAKRPNQPFYQVRPNNDWPLGSYADVSPTEASPEGQEAHARDKRDQWPQFKPDRPKGTESPFLQVEIPNVQLERYSVMFGGLLGKPSPRGRIPSHEVGCVGLEYTY